MATTLRQTLLFARTFLKNPVMLGSFVPSSRYLTNRILRSIDWKRARVIVEYGPGVGTVTTEMLQRMSPGAQLIAIESNAEFVGYLRHSVRDPRLIVVHGSAADVENILADRGIATADYIISGIPYSVLPPEVREAILRASREVLAPGGAFLAFQFTGVVLPHLRRVFGSVRQDFELLNVLPARIFCCRA